MNVETMADENGNTKFNGYLKNAQIDWKGKGFFVSAGLVNLKQFSEQENFWGHRYIFKSFQEEYGIAFCEDIGIVAGYEFSPVISADMALTNGEGRKFKNMDNNYKYGAGLTLKTGKRIYVQTVWRHIQYTGVYEVGFWKSEKISIQLQPLRGTATAGFLSVQNITVLSTINFFPEITIKKSKR